MIKYTIWIFYYYVLLIHTSYSSLLLGMKSEISQKSFEEIQKSFGDITNSQKQSHMAQFIRLSIHEAATQKKGEGPCMLYPHPFSCFVLNRKKDDGTICDYFPKIDGALSKKDRAHVIDKLKKHLINHHSYCIIPPEYKSRVESLRISEPLPLAKDFMIHLEKTRSEKVMNQLNTIVSPTGKTSYYTLVAKPLLAAAHNFKATHPEASFNPLACHFLGLSCGYAPGMKNEPNVKNALKAALKHYKKDHPDFFKALLKTKKESFTLKRKTDDTSDYTKNRKLSPRATPESLARLEEESIIVSSDETPAVPPSLPGKDTHQPAPPETMKLCDYFHYDYFPYSYNDTHLLELYPEERPL